MDCEGGEEGDVLPQLWGQVILGQILLGSLVMFSNSSQYILWYSFFSEIIFLRAITPTYPANQADIIFDITEGNLRDSFDIIKRYMDGMTVGE